MFKNFFTIL